MEMNSSAGPLRSPQLFRVQHERAALLESGSTIYTAWSGLFGDCGAYSSWVISYNADTLLQTSAIDLAPDNTGGGIWMGGGGPAADSSGDIYIISGNTFGDHAPGAEAGAPGYYGNSFVRLSGSNTLTVKDFFTPFNSVNEDAGDVDFGSTAPLILPDLVDSSNTTHHLAVGSSKDGNMYVVERSNMGQFNSTKNNIFQQLRVASNEVRSPAIFFNNTVFVGPSSTSIEAFPITTTTDHLAISPSSQSANTFSTSAPSISANGTTSGIVWALDPSAGILFAFDAANLGTKLYDSNQAASNRDHFGTIGSNFITPMVASGRVYIGTQNSIVAFGTLP
jgi:hypothetical protein